jgi:hypothetical protein
MEPVNGNTFTALQPFIIKVEGSDDVALQSIAISIDGAVQKICAATYRKAGCYLSAPPLTVGSHTITASVTDTVGQSTTSESVTVLMTDDGCTTNN